MAVRQRFNPLTRQFNIVKDSVDLGSTFQGMYSTSTSYTPGQSVTLSGGMYVCLQAGAGRDPSTNPTYWEKLNLQGPQGIAGPQGPRGDNAELLRVIAGENIGAQRIVAVNAAGKAVYADAQNPAHAKCVVGITTASVLASEELSVQVAGKMSDSGWSFTPGAALFLGSNSLLSEIPPSTGFVKIMGFSVAPTQAVIQMQSSISKI